MPEACFQPKLHLYTSLHVLLLFHSLTRNSWKETLVLKLSLFARATPMKFHFAVCAPPLSNERRGVVLTVLRMRQQRRRDEQKKT